MSHPGMHAPGVFSRYASLVFRFRWGVAALLVFVTLFFVWQMQGLRFNNSEDIWFVEGDPTLAQTRKFRELFGNDDFVYLVFEAERVFTPHGLRRIGELADELKKKVPHVRDVTWLGNAEYMEGRPGALVIDDFFDPEAVTAADLPRIRDRALKENLYRDSLISSDARSLGLVIEMAEYPQDRADPRSEITPVVRDILAQPRYQELSPRVVGQPILHHDYNTLSLTESRTFFGLCLLIQIALLYALTRKFRGVLIPLGVVVLSVVWTMGMIGLLGFTLNLFIIMVPTLLVCMGIGDSMHVIALFNRLRDQGESVRAAMSRALGEAGPPCLLTSITSAAGFLAFNAVDIQPFREMGVYAAVGVMMAFGVTLLLTPLAFGAFGRDVPPPMERKKDRGRKRPGSRDPFDALLLWIYRINVAGPRRIIAVFGLILLLSLVGYLRVEVETHTARMLSPELSLRQAYDDVDQRMGGSMAVEIMLDTGRPDGVKDPAFLRDLERLQRRLDAHPLVTKTVSAVDLVKKMNQAMHAGHGAYYGIPGDRSELVQYLLLYEMSDGQEWEKLVSFEGDVARLSAKTRTLGTKQVRALAREVETDVREIFGKHVRVAMAGSLYWMKSMNDLLGQGQQRSFLAAGIVVLAAVMIGLRSLKLGLISIFPNLFPVFITLAIMGFGGIYMDMPLMSFSAIIIGVVVDDSIHFLSRYREEFRISASYEEALRATLLSVGRPMVFTTLTLTLGFGILLLSDLSGVAKFGGLAGFAFVWALLADLFCVPALMLVLHPLGREQDLAADARYPIRGEDRFQPSRTAKGERT